MAALLPVNPLGVLDDAAQTVISELARQLDAIAEAQTARDAEANARALPCASAPTSAGSRRRSAGGQEVVTIAPARCRRRQHFHRYAAALRHLEPVILYTRSVARRSVTALPHDEH